MITTKIKALFKFIEFLHSNIDNFNNYNDLINELEFLEIEKEKLKPQNNYKDKLKFDVLQVEFETKFHSLTENTANYIKAKAKELDVCNSPDSSIEVSFLTSSLLDRSWEIRPLNPPRD